MAMGAFNPHNMYRQENAMGNASAILGLLKAKSEEYNKIGTAVDEYGQSRVRGKVSELMGTKEFKDMDPAEAQAAVALLSGGRDLGDNFAKTLKMSDDNKGEIQGNKWDEDKATTLFGRQNSQIAQKHGNAVSLMNARHKNSVSLAGMNNKARQKLYGDTTVTGSKGSGTTSPGVAAKLAKMKNDNITMENLLKTETDPKIRQELETRLYETRIQAEQLLSGTKMPAGGKGAAVNGLFGGAIPGGKASTKPITGLGKKGSVGLNKTDLINLNKLKEANLWSPSSKDGYSNIQLPSGKVIEVTNSEAARYAAKTL